MIEKVCEYCQKGFLAKSKSAKYCSSNCNANSFYNKNKDEIKICLNCNKPTGRIAKFCNKECSLKFRLGRAGFAQIDSCANNRLSLRWELLNRIAPQDIKDLMYKIELRLPIQ